MSKLSALSSNPMIAEYAQTTAKGALQPIADYIAPTVEVGTAIGRFKKFNPKSRFAIPDTRRGIGGRATVLDFSKEDGSYNCEPHALDVPVDELEKLEEADLVNSVNERADEAAFVASLSHEKAVIDAALTAAGAGTGKTWNSSADPIADLDDAILTVMKAAAIGSGMEIGVVFGPTAWKIAKNQAEVRKRIVAGAPGGLTVVTLNTIGQLLMGTPDVRTSFMVVDTKKEGLTPTLDFLLSNVILIFARNPQPNRRDPSFMKTFRLRGQWMKPRFYTRDDGRVEYAGFDWSEDIQVTNSAAVVRLNIS